VATIHSDLNGNAKRSGAIALADNIETTHRKCYFSTCFPLWIPYKTREKERERKKKTRDFILRHRSIERGRFVRDLTSSSTDARIISVDVEFTRAIREAKAAWLLGLNNLLHCRIEIDTAGSFSKFADYRPIRRVTRSSPSTDSEFEP